MTDTDDPSSAADRIISCFLQPLHLAYVNHRDSTFFFPILELHTDPDQVLLETGGNALTLHFITPSVRAGHIAIPGFQE